MTVALSQRIDEFIKFLEPQEERDAVNQGFYEIANFSCAIGIIDALHIRIIAPTENEPDFVNRKRCKAFMTTKVFFKNRTFYFVIVVFLFLDKFAICFYSTIISGCYRTFFKTAYKLQIFRLHKINKAD